MTIFKKILLAIKSKDIKDIFTQISSHRQGISMSLSATGRYVVWPVRPLGLAGSPCAGIESSLKRYLADF
jgi:hypothetical protein